VEDPLAREPRGRRVSTFVAWAGDQLVETISLSWCAPGGMACAYDQIEALRLLSPTRPWADLLGCAPHEIGELTRLAIRRDYQGNAQTEAKLRMFRSMTRLALDFAARHGVAVVLAIMPPTVTRLMAQARVAIRRVDGVDLAHDDTECAALYRRYPRYWLPDQPRFAPQLYVFEQAGTRALDRVGVPRARTAELRTSSVYALPG
jgi:hypothetical protein